MTALRDLTQRSATELRYDVVIVGGGHAGAQAAIALRQENFGGTIAIIGDEPELPYERPPLSKDYLSGDKAFERILIRQADFWQTREVTLRLGERVVTVDPAHSRVETGIGARIAYGDLVWATGGAPRRLTCTGSDLRGVHAIRTRTDVDRLIAELPAARDIVVIGGGYIGLEAAAVLAKAGKPVTVIEAQERVLARVAGETLSRFYEQEHRAHGVTFMLGATVAGLEGAGAVSGVRLAGGAALPAQIVIVGIGIEPAVAPLLAAGARGGNGVVVDAQCRTSLPNVFAIGDCAAHHNRFADGRLIRLESVQNANDQANVAARAIVGRPSTYDAMPWFWSNQYDLKLQTVGLSVGHDEAVVRGNRADRRFSIIYLREGRVVALDCVNAVKDYVQGRALVLARGAIAHDILADTSIELKAMVTPDGEAARTRQETETIPLQTGVSS